MTVLGIRESESHAEFIPGFFECLGVYCNHLAALPILAINERRKGEYYPVVAARGVIVEIEQASLQQIRDIIFEFFEESERRSFTTGAASELTLVKEAGCISGVKELPPFDGEKEIKISFINMYGAKPMNFVHAWVFEIITLTMVSIFPGRGQREYRNL
jgi:hypothetical protein